MCGRYALALSNEEVYDALQNQLPRMFQGERRWDREQDYRPNYNIAPRQRAAVIHRDSDTGSPVLETMQWGLIPHWTKHPPTGAMNTINARSESLLDPSSGGMWQSLKAHKRCVIPAQGYYEWHKRSPSSKVAHFTRSPLGPKDNNAAPPLIFFAGLWDLVKYLAPVESKFQTREGDDREPYPTGNPLPLATFTILTTTPTKDIEWLHDRMPCVLQGEEEVERWLGLGKLADKGWEEGKGGTGELLRGMPGLDCYPVNPEVGKIGTNSPTYIQPVSERSDGIKSFFQKQAPSPAKSKGITGKSNFSQADKGSQGVKKESAAGVKKQSDTKKAVEEMKTEVDDGEVKIEVKGAGDDSNAPNPSASADEKPAIKQEKSTPSKRKRIDAPDDDSEEGGVKRKATEKRGGHQTKVIRRADSDDGSKAQPSITNFFQSPSTKNKPDPPAARAKRGLKTTRQTKR